MPDWHGECSQEVLEANAALPCRCKEPTSHGRAGVMCARLWMPKEASVCVGALFGLGWSFFSGKLCKAELHSAGRLFVAGLKCLPEL